MKKRVIQRAEEIRAICLLRGQGQAKTKKPRNGRKCAFGHARILKRKRRERERNLRENRRQARAERDDL
jgi:hypothetical protein